MAIEKQGLLRIFTEIFKDVKPDVALAKRIADFKIGFINKNEDHMAFFGGNLTGSYVVRWIPRDREKFFTDVLRIDELDVADAILTVEEVKADRKVSSDALNQTCMWVIHMFLTSNLPDKIKKQAMIDTALIMHFRWITSIMSRDYKYVVDPQVATAVYAQLTYKFAIKQYGSWYATLEARCEDMIDKDNGLHYYTLQTYFADEKVVYMINDTQGRIRDMMKNLFRELEKVLNQGSKVKTSSNLIDLDSEQIFKDKTRSLTVYTRYLHSIIGDRDAFIKGELLEVIEKAVFTAPPKLVLETLEWCSANNRYTGSQEVEEFVDAVLIHSFNYIADHRTVYAATSDLAGFMARLKGVYMASRMNDKDVLDIRVKSEAIVRKATKTKNNSVVSAVRTAIMLYVVLRAFTMNHYSGAQ